MQQFCHPALCMSLSFTEFRGVYSQASSYQRTSNLDPALKMEPLAIVFIGICDSLHVLFCFSHHSHHHYTHHFIITVIVFLKILSCCKNLDIATLDMALPLFFSAMTAAMDQGQPL